MLVIDGNMRHGSSLAYVDKTEDGLSDYIGGETCDIDSIISTSEEIPTIQMITIGTVPSNPTELLESPRFGQLIEHMRQRYDYIIFDCVGAGALKLILRDSDGNLSLFKNQPNQA